MYVHDQLMKAATTTCCAPQPADRRAAQARRARSERPGHVVAARATGGAGIRWSVEEQFQAAKAGQD